MQQHLSLNRQLAILRRRQRLAALAGALGEQVAIDALEAELARVERSAVMRLIPPEGPALGLYPEPVYWGTVVRKCS